jgi:hypothetical protein
MAALAIQRRRLFIFPSCSFFRERSVRSRLICLTNFWGYGFSVNLFLPDNPRDPDHNRSARRQADNLGAHKQR